MKKFGVQEKCTAEIGEMSSVENSFWVNHATENARNSAKSKIFESTIVPGKRNCLYSVIFDKEGKMIKERPK